MFDVFNKSPLSRWGRRKLASRITQHTLFTATKSTSIQAPAESSLFTSFTQTEQAALLALARAVLQEVDRPKADFASFLSGYTENRSIIDTFAARTDTYTIDVILWVDGYIRGSQFVEGKPLLSAIYDATQSACADSRFKPVTKREYDSMRIELVVISNELQALTAEELSRNEINPEQAYLGVTADGQRSWLVPATHNCRDFKDLAQFLKTLTEEKLRSTVPREAAISFYRAAVVDFIESANQKSVVTLSGVRAVGVDRTKDDRMAHISRALSFILKNQDVDGNFQPINSPFSINRPNVVDWVRSAFLLSALVRVIKQYPDIPEAVTYRRAVDISYSYLTKHLYSVERLPPAQRCLALIYLHQAAILRDDKVEMERSHTVIGDLFPTLPYEPILYTQFALYGCISPQRTEKEIKLTERAIQTVLSEFYQLRDSDSRVNSLELALYADLPNALKAGGHAFGRSEWVVSGATLYEWFLKQQNQDGSFPYRFGGNFAHSRSTGKILEALAMYGLSYTDPQFELALSWLHSMQYTDETTYYVPCERRDWLLGGFRHDQQNATARIDSSAHYLRVLCE